MNMKSYNDDQQRTNDEDLYAKISGHNFDTFK